MYLYMGSVTIFKKEIPSKHKSSLISLFKIHISFSAGVKEKNFWFLGLLPLNAIFIVMFWTNQQKCCLSSILYVLHWEHIKNKLKLEGEILHIFPLQCMFMNLNVYMYMYLNLYIYQNVYMSLSLYNHVYEFLDASEFVHVSECVDVSEFLNAYEFLPVSEIVIVFLSQNRKLSGCAFYSCVALKCKLLQYITLCIKKNLTCV